MPVVEHAERDDRFDERETFRRAERRILHRPSRRPSQRKARMRPVEPKMVTARAESVLFGRAPRRRCHSACCRSDRSNVPSGVNCISVAVPKATPNAGRGRGRQRRSARRGGEIGQRSAAAGTACRLRTAPTTSWSASAPGTSSRTICTRVGADERHAHVAALRDRQLAWPGSSARARRASRRRRSGPAARCRWSRPRCR